MTKKVLVLLATNNGIAWVDEQLKSIRSQDGVEISILASDDASSDGTRELLSSTPAVTLLPSHDRLGSAGRNFFHLWGEADLSGHDYVALSDQDDVWNPCKLQRAIEQLDAHQCEGYSANVTACWDDGREMLVDKAKAQQPWDFLFEAAGPGCTYVVTARLARDIQRVLRENPTIRDLVARHDWFIYAWARTHGFLWHIDERPSLRYRQHATNVVGVNSGVRATFKRLAQVKSGWYRGQVELIAGFCGCAKDEAIKKMLKTNWSGRLYLAVHARQCRRSRSDAIALSLTALLGWF